MFVGASYNFIYNPSELFFPQRRKRKENNASDNQTTQDIELTLSTPFR